MSTFSWPAFRLGRRLLPALLFFTVGNSTRILSASALTMMPLTTLCLLNLDQSGTSSAACAKPATTKATDVRASRILRFMERSSAVRDKINPFDAVRLAEVHVKSRFSQEIDG